MFIPKERDMKEREIKIPQTPIQHPRISQDISQLTPEYLDSIINNPNEHEMVRKNALDMKDKLFPVTKRDLSENDFIVDKELKIEPKVTPIVEARKNSSEEFHITPMEPSRFDVFLSEIKNNLFNDEFLLLSSPSTKIQLRSLTVEEYKFLTKQFEIYQNSFKETDKNDPNYIREIDLRESILTNAIDNVLQRCVTNGISIYDLTFFDWVFAILALRSVSRGTEENLKVICTKKDCKNEIQLGVMNVLKNIQSLKDTFIVNPLKIIPINEKYSIYLGIPTRGELVEAQKLLLEDPDSSLNLLNSVMYIKALVENKDVLLLNPYQRLKLMNTLNFNVIQEINKTIDENKKKFYSCFGEIKCEKCGKITEIDISDFILFFYDF
jgi:hypothetical protein